jgi:DNA ligase-1
MRRLAEACERVAGTSKKLEKIALVAEYLQAASQVEAAGSALFLSGRPFPVWEETTLQVGGSLLWKVLEALSGKSGQDLSAFYRQLGDLGSVAAAVLPGRRGPELTVLEVQNRFRQIAAARGAAAKTTLVGDLLSQADPIEAKYIVKIMTGDLRIGLKESLVEEAIAKAYGAQLGAVQRANMLLGDISETLQLARGNALSSATLRLFHPLGFMLASPAASAEEAWAYFKDAWVEDKYDGIRAQAHCSGDRVRIFSRTRDDITESFPEVAQALSGFPRDCILDGEIVAWSFLVDEPNQGGRALPFNALQKRLGRKKVSLRLLQEVPAAYLVFDVLWTDGELMLDRPLRERARILEKLLAQPRARKAGFSPSAAQGRLGFATPETENQADLVMRAPLFQAGSPQELAQLFDAAQARGNEGLMIKHPESAYTPGRRGKSWLKLKRELATLDVVVTAVEYGHGKRIAVLSDYTFAVREGERLVNIGKAYSGLTDLEIAAMTAWFLEHTLEDQGLRRVVEPKIVIEVAFNNMMKSDRHNSGYALRFPRIVRLRPDKPAEEADSMDRVREIFENQSARA